MDQQEDVCSTSGSWSRLALKVGWSKKDHKEYSHGLLAGIGAIPRRRRHGVHRVRGVLQGINGVTMAMLILVATIITTATV